MPDRAGLWGLNRMQDIIYIKDLRVQTIIGIFGWEREVRQEVSIDLEMVFDCKRAAKTDTIEDTIDYKKITKGIIQFVEESEFQLQETLAESIAELVKNEYKVHSLKLRVSKPGALRQAEDVGVIIHR
jgi:dihydroneopterin aldolase